MKAEEARKSQAPLEINDWDKKDKPEKEESSMEAENNEANKS